METAEILRFDRLTSRSRGGFFFLPSVCITYKPAKAAHMVHLHNCAGTGFAPALRSDLDHFKLPHPKIANVNQVTSSGIEFSYRTFDGSVGPPHAPQKSLEVMVLSQTLFFNVLRTFEKREGPYSKRIFKMKNNPEIEGLKAKLSEEMTLNEIEEWRILPVDGRDANRSRSPTPSRAEYRAPSPYRRPSWTDSARRPFARSGYNRSPDKRRLDRCTPSLTDSPRRQLARYSRSPSADRPDRLPSWTDLPQKPLARYNRCLSTDRRTFAHDLTIATRVGPAKIQYS
ncbi:hypothetical protein B0H11DRAFT_2088561 [Mycena galericulata]|nr:hypothetical protein B0H11DRAFT_2088561 [Mycena galericulata]